MPVWVTIVKLMEHLDPPSQGQDGGLPHRPGLGSHTHRELDLEGVHVVNLGVFLHYEAPVVVAQLARPRPGSGGHTAD